MAKKNANAKLRVMLIAGLFVLIGLVILLDSFLGQERSRLLDMLIPLLAVAVGWAFRDRLNGNK